MIYIIIILLSNKVPDTNFINWKRGSTSRNERKIYQKTLVQSNHFCLVSISLNFEKCPQFVHRYTCTFASRVFSPISHFFPLTFFLSFFFILEMRLCTIYSVTVIQKLGCCVFLFNNTYLRKPSSVTSRKKNIIPNALFRIWRSHYFALSRHQLASANCVTALTSRDGILWVQGVPNVENR